MTDYYCHGLRPKCDIAHDGRGWCPGCGPYRVATAEPDDRVEEHGCRLPPELLGRTEDNVLAIIADDWRRIQKGLAEPKAKRGKPTENVAARFLAECARKGGAK